MAKITAYIPEPTPEYSPNNQRQILMSLDTIKQELNTTFQEDLKQEIERMVWFSMRFGC